LFLSVHRFELLCIALINSKTRDAASNADIYEGNRDHTITSRADLLPIPLKKWKMMNMGCGMLYRILNMNFKISSPKRKIQ